MIPCGMVQLAGKARCFVISRFIDKTIELAIILGAIGLVIGVVIVVLALVA